MPEDKMKENYMKYVQFMVQNIVFKQNMVIGMNNLQWKY